MKITLLLAPLSFKMEVTNASGNCLFQAICEAKQIVPDGRYSFQCRTLVGSLEFPQEDCGLRAKYFSLSAIISCTYVPRIENAKPS